jgi:hypothetical protein
MKCTETAVTIPAARPFCIDVPKEELIDLRRRIAATRWPDREAVAD